jgi:hypothetical protein
MHSTNPRTLKLLPCPFKRPCSWRDFLLHLYQSNIGFYLPAGRRDSPLFGSLFVPNCGTKEADAARQRCVSAGEVIAAEIPNEPKHPKRFEKSNSSDLAMRAARRSKPPSNYLSYIQFTLL